MRTLNSSIFFTVAAFFISLSAQANVSDSVLQRILNQQNNLVSPLKINSLISKTLNEKKPNSNIGASKNKRETFISDMFLQRKLNLSQVFPYFPSQHTTAHSFNKKPTTTQLNQARYNYLKKTLKNQEKSTTFWQYGWATGYSLGAIKTFLDRDDIENKPNLVKNNVRITSALAALGIHTTIDRYPNIHSEKSIFDNPSLSFSEKIEAADALFKKRAAFVKRNKSLKDRFLSYGISLISSAILYDRVGHSDAFTHLGLSVLGIESARRSLPKKALQDWDDYQKFNSEQHSNLEISKDPYIINFTPTYNGLALNLVF